MSALSLEERWQYDFVFECIRALKDAGYVMSPVRLLGSDVMVWWIVNPVTEHRLQLRYEQNYAPGHRFVLLARKRRIWKPVLKPWRYQPTK